MEVMGYLMYLFILALFFRLRASASATAVSKNRSTSLEMVQSPGLANTTLLVPESRIFPDPYDSVVAPQVLTIEFYGYRGTLNYSDLNDCMRHANDDIRRETQAGRAQASMGVDPYVYSNGTVTLFLHPDEQLTWSRWSLAPAAIQKFVQENGLRGTQFVLLWQGMEPVGYGSLVTPDRTPSPPPPPPHTPSTALSAFPDPFDRHWDSAGLTIEFYGYRGTIPPHAMANCLAAARADFRAHLPVITQPMTSTASSYSYTAGSVAFVLVPTADLYWYMWGILPDMIQIFVSDNGFRGTQFIIIKDGVGPIGSGHLLDESRDGLSIS